MKAYGGVDVYVCKGSAIKLADCSTDGVVGNKECEILSGVVCNPTSTAITVQYVLTLLQL
jgi:hypothetical protein